MIELIQFIIPPTDENDSSDLEHDDDEEEADEGEEEEGSLPVHPEAGEEGDNNLCDANAEHEEGEVQPASLLVKNAVIVLKGFRHDLNLQMVFYIFRC